MLGRLLKRAVAAVPKVINAVKRVVKHATNRVVNRIKSVTKRAVATVGRVVNTAKSIGKQINKKVRAAVATSVKAVKNTAKAVENGAKKVKAGIDQISNAVEQKADEVITDINNRNERIKEKVKAEAEKALATTKRGLIVTGAFGALTGLPSLGYNKNAFVGLDFLLQTRKAIIEEYPLLNIYSNTMKKVVGAVKGGIIYGGQGVGSFIYNMNIPGVSDLVGEFTHVREAGAESNLFSGYGAAAHGLWVDGVLGTVDGLANVVADPLEAVEGINKILAYPEEMLPAMGKGIAKFVKKKIINGTPEERAEAAGQAVFEVGSWFVGVGEAKLAAETAKTAKVAEGAVDAVKLAKTAAEASKVADVAGDATKLAKTATEVTKAADIAEDATKLAKTAAEASKVADVAEDATKLAKTASEVFKEADRIEDFGKSTEFVKVIEKTDDFEKYKKFIKVRETVEGSEIVERTSVVTETIENLLTSERTVVETKTLENLVTAQRRVKTTKTIENLMTSEKTVEVTDTIDDLGTLEKIADEAGDIRINIKGIKPGVKEGVRKEGCLNNIRKSLNDVTSGIMKDQRLNPAFPEGEFIDETSKVPILKNEVQQNYIKVIEENKSGSSVNIKTKVPESNIEKVVEETGNFKRPSKIEVGFNKNPKHNTIEFKRQLKAQEEGLNSLTIDEYLTNRARYLREGRALEGNAAQKLAREEVFKEKVVEFRKQGLSREDATKKASEWIKDKAALHNPDQIAGGNPVKIGGVGDKRINSSLGSQWKSRIDVMDEQIRKMADNMTVEERKSIYINVKLTE